VRRAQPFPKEYPLPFANVKPVHSMLAPRELKHTSALPI
jgi:hypothetical protein